MGTSSDNSLRRRQCRWVRPKTQRCGCSSRSLQSDWGKPVALGVEARGLRHGRSSPEVSPCRMSAGDIAARCCLGGARGPGCCLLSWGWGLLAPVSLSASPSGAQGCRENPAGREVRGAAPVLPSAAMPGERGATASSPLLSAACCSSCTRLCSGRPCPVGAVVVLPGDSGCQMTSTVTR